MKKYLLFASAILAFASCANDNYLGTEDEKHIANGDQAITFGFDVPTPTRAEGAAAATKLNNQFIVWGEKGEATSGAVHTEDDGGANTHQLVFPNYKVTYTTNSAYTTTSNTKDWEYVGLKWSTEDAANVKMGGTAVTENDQTIKYWDYAAASYTFTAVSAKPEDITDGRVVINKITSGSDVYAKGYTVTLSKTAATGTDPDIYPSLADLYFSDRNYIEQGTGKDRTADNAYGGNVKLQFRNSLTQVRAGVYETIPGYEVTAIKFYVTSDTEATDGATPTPTSAFGAICPNVKADNFTGTIDVTYYDGTVGPLNTPKLTITPDAGLSKNDLILGTNMSTLSTAKTLGTTSTSPTWDQVDGSGNGLFTSVLPQIANTTNLKLKVDYTLWNSVTGETINITGKTAEVPGKYLAWKPNFKYTYLFKITDDDLYPITFDAITIEAEDGTAEYITTVSEPSITTFGVKGNKYQVGKDQYEATSDVYATIVESGAVIDPTGKYNVYTVTTTNATNFPITEASVAESLAEISAKNPEVKCTAYAGTKSLETTVPGEDGKTITLSVGKAIKLPALAAGTYAVEYVKTARTYKFVVVPIADETAFAAAKAALNLYTAANESNALESSATYDSSATYYKKVVDNVGVYAYKVIVVQ